MIRKWAILVGILVIIGLLMYKALDLGLVWFVYPSKETYPIRGIDVSHHQGNINWALVPQSEISFVYMKATEGGDFKDKSFVKNWREAKNQGFRVGAYHFFTLCRSGVEQAQNFIDTVPKEINSLPPVIDLEFVGNCKDRPKVQFVQKEILDFLNKVDSHYNTKTVLYLTNEFIEKYLGEEFFGHPIWIRNIFVHPDTFSSLDWILWQFKSTARIPGIDGPVDLNVLKGNLERLDQFTNVN